jgi:hypothetical protein
MRYATPEAFRAALEDRLKHAQNEQVGLSRLRKRVVFERLLARLTAHAENFTEGLQGRRGPSHAALPLPASSPLATSSFTFSSASLSAIGGGVNMRSANAAP